MRELRLGPLYPITAHPNRHGLSHVQLARIYAEAGIPLFQIREKQGDTRDYFLQVRAAVQAAPDSQVFVNDRLDVALLAEAGGVHLGWEDLPATAARTLVGDRLLIGISTHTPDQFRQAQELDVDYVALGPVLPSATKQSRYPALGLDATIRLAREKRKPVVAIGGIEVAAAQTLWANGIESVAVIGGLVQAEDPPFARIQQFMAAWKGM